MSEAEIIEQRSVYSGRIIQVQVDRVRLPNGHNCDLDIVRHPGAAAVVPVDGQGNVLMVRQYRHATGGWLLEVPAGKLDAREPPEACARREVEEETGFSVGALTELGWIWTTPGFSNERIWLYLATDLAVGSQRLEHDEVLTVQPITCADAIRMAESGEIQDGKSVCALLRAAPHLKRFT